MHLVLVSLYNMKIERENQKANTKVTFWLYYQVIKDKKSIILKGIVTT